MKASVLRLPMVFGPEDFQFRNRHGKIIRRLFDHHPQLILGAVEQSSLFTYGFIENVSAAIVHAAENPIVDGRVYNLGEQRSRSFRRWADLYAEVVGRKFDFAVLPDALIERDLSVQNYPPRLLQFDTQKFRNETEFCDPVSSAEQVRRTLRWGFENPESLGPKPDYANEKNMIRSFHEFINNSLK